MARDDREKQHHDLGSAAPDAVRTPQVSLLGTVDNCMAEKWRDALNTAMADEDAGSDPFVVDMTTLGGDPEMARRMIVDLDIAREKMRPRRLVFYGKSVVYSAGVTFMAGFPREDRFIDANALLLIHSRQLKKTIELEGPLRPSVPLVKALLHQLETGIDLENKNFERLIEGSDVTMDELNERALYNWYLPAQEALERGLIAGIVQSAPQS